MISYIRGTLEEISDSYFIIECGGIGYRVFVSGNTAAKYTQTGISVKIYTYMSVKEDGISLFGFSSMEELDIFQKLLSVSGVGPKAALGFLDTLNPTEIILAVISEDIKTLSRAPGIGKKTAQRVILDLKDKFKNMDFIESVNRESVGGSVSVSSDAKYEAIEALAALGYSRSEALRAVNAVDAAGLTTEEILKGALKKMI